MCLVERFLSAVPESVEGTMVSQVRFALVVSFSLALLAIEALPAQADVTVNQRFIQNVTIVNPCELGEGPIALTVEGHQVTRAMPDGQVIIHFNFHGTGVSASGTEYVINQTQVRVVTGSGFTAEFFIRRVSKGSNDNALIDRTLTSPPPVDVVFDVKCVG